MTPARYTITFLDRPDSKGRYRAALKMMGAESVRIEEKEAEATEPKPKKDNTPTKPVSLAVAALFDRSPQDEWTDTEMKAFGDAHKTKTLTVENMKIVTAHYVIERKKQDNHCRTSVLTFLRYWTSELDKARAAKPANGRALEWLDSRKVVAMPVPPEEAARIAAAAKVAAEEFRKTQRA